MPDARQALPLSVGLALIACLCAATAIGQLAKLFPAAGGLYTYAARSLGPWARLLVAWLFAGFQPLVAPFLYLEFGWAMGEVMKGEAGWNYTGQWWIWVLLMTVIVYVLASYAWVVGAGLNHFVAQATGADPWRNLGKVSGARAGSSSSLRSATRSPRTRDHRDGRRAAGDRRLHMLLCVGCLWHYSRARRSEFNPLVHLVLPIGGIVLFFFPLYYQYYKVPPAYPFKYANWIALAWAGTGVVVTTLVVRFAPQRLRDVERVYVEDEFVTPVA